MTQRLLALCFGLPVNAGHADGISHSLRDQFTITIIVFRRQSCNKTNLQRFTQRRCFVTGCKDVLTWCIPKDGIGAFTDTEQR